ncbi:MAG: phage virion morphogenesis protein [Helicobacteraceae bacterium]|nr:phage virion morphogenesis protein [Helicobacteraceae bacterium]
MIIDPTGLDEIQDTLKSLENKTDDIKPLLKELANHLYNGVKYNFENQVTPDGESWTPIKFRKTDNTPSKILYDHGHMQKTLYAKTYKHSLTLGINATSNGYAYPLVHQFGTKDKTTPARAFMPIKLNGSLYDGVEKELDEIIEEYITI